ncbi:MAG: type II secretion system protein GspK [Candidatus Brocadiia bacterium]|jgi:type II secretory pathway component PulK
MTVLVLSILVVLGYAFSYSAGVYGSTARNARDALRRECAAESALNMAMAMLRANGGTGRFDSLDQPWAAADLSFQIGTENVLVNILDENRKLNVNRAACPPADPTKSPDLRDALERLVEIAGGSRSDFDEICAWIDPATPGPHDDLAPKSPLPMIAGLRRIPELKPSLFTQSALKPQLDSLLSTHPARINLNTASREVLDALWGDPTISQQVIAQREQQPFQSDAAVAAFVQGLDPASSGPAILAQALSAQSDYFTVTVTPADGPNEALEALVRRTDATTQVVFVKRVSKEVEP